MNCTNCFQSIRDGRKAVRCTTCNKPLHKECAINENNNIYCDVCYTVKTEENNQSANTDIIIPDVIRRTHIETYRACPYKFYLEVIKGIPIPPTIYTQIGIDLHELFDKACNDKKYKINDMKHDFENIWNNYNEELFDTFLGNASKKEQKLRMYNRAINSINTFYNVLSTLPPNPYTTEKQIIYSVGDNLPKISITSDRTDLCDGEILMSDWKTGQVMIGQRLSNDLQAPLYIKAVENEYNLPVRKFTFYYLDENKTRVFERTEKDDQFVCTVNKRKYYISPIDAVREVQHIFAQIKKCNFNIPRNTKNMYFTCKTCYYKQQTICQGAELECWKQYNKEVK